MIKVSRQSDVAAPRERVWSVVSRLSGVNDELAPFLRMTRGNHDDQLFPAQGNGTVSFSSWILLLGLLPLDRHSLNARSAGFRFAEESHSWLQRVWRHTRRLDEIPGGTRIRDDIEFEPRIAVLAPIVGPIIEAIFRHRHKRLVRRFGVLSRAGGNG